MTTHIRPTDIRECGLCDDQAGTTATIYEVFDDETRVAQHKPLFICRRHAKNLLSVLPLILRVPWPEQGTVDEG